MDSDDTQAIPFPKLRSAPPCDSPEHSTYERGINAMIASPPDYASAWLLCNSAAEAGCTHAAFHRILLILNGLGCERDERRAVKMLRESTDRNALRLLDIVYESGRGKNEEEDAELLEKLIREGSEGNAASLEKAARMSFYGYGCEPSKTDAYQLWNRAASLGNRDALNSMGWMTWLGHGCKVDVGKSMNFMRTAADRGCLVACGNLGVR